MIRAAPELLGLVVLSCGLVAQEAQRGMVEWLPMAPGATWQYRIQQRPEGTTVRLRWQCTRSVRAPGGPVWEVRVSFAARAGVFHPSRPADWQALIAEEHHDLDQTGGVALTKAYGVLWATVGSAKYGPRARGTEIQVGGNRDFAVKAWILGTSDTGEKVRGFAHMEFAAGKLSAIQSNLVAQQAVLIDSGKKR